RHAIGRMADITADRFMEGPPASRWFLNPIATFILWRRQRLWAIRKWDTILELEQERRIYIAKLRKEHGRWAWRRKATADQALVLSLAKDGMSVTEAIELPAREEAKRLEEESRIARQAERAAYERRQQEENERLERERKALELEEARQKAERDHQLAEAQHQARIDELARQQRAAAEAEDRRCREEQLEHARLVAEQQERAAAAAKQRQEAEQAARVQAEQKEAAEMRAAEVRNALANLNQANREPRTSATPNSGNREPAERGTAGTSPSHGTPNREPSANKTTARTANPANLNDRAAAKQNQVISVLELMDELGFEAVTLGVVISRTGMSKTTSYHRLTEARAVWNQRAAS
ncbi:hypothetical protein IQ62_01740, partial [Streptomyces scabiei]|uniref:hypothetical protein n=1 Tax=Streptomyces scabiei TaxID=1930 RepID=UPI0004E71F33